MLKYNKEEIIKVNSESKSMAEAASKLGIHPNTHRRISIKIGCYFPNQSGKGKEKKMPKIPIQDILSGFHPYFNTYKLKIRLFKEGLKKNICEICGIKDWNGLPINCELDHIDGDRNNHKIENLRVICPNCHSQTDTFRSKNRNKKMHS